MRRFLLACLIVPLCTTVRLAAEPAPQLVEEYWETAQLDGVKIGATQTTVSLPDDAMKGLGGSWTWTQTILVDGVESPRCTATSPG